MIKRFSRDVVFGDLIRRKEERTLQCKGFVIKVGQLYMTESWEWVTQRFKNALIFVSWEEAADYIQSHGGNPEYCRIVRIVGIPEREPAPWVQS